MKSINIANLCVFTVLIPFSYLVIRLLLIWLYNKKTKTKQMQLNNYANPVPRPYINILDKFVFLSVLMIFVYLQLSTFALKV